MIRTGINKKNLEFWENLYINEYGYTSEIAKIKAQLICQEQEISRNKERIIELEKNFKQLKKLTKNK